MKSYAKMYQLGAQINQDDKHYDSIEKAFNNPKCDTDKLEIKQVEISCCPYRHGSKLSAETCVNIYVLRYEQILIYEYEHIRENEIKEVTKVTQKSFCFKPEPGKISKLNKWKSTPEKKIRWGYPKVHEAANQDKIPEWRTKGWAARWKSIKENGVPTWD